MGNQRSQTWFMLDIIFLYTLPVANTVQSSEHTS